MASIKSFLFVLLCPLLTACKPKIKVKEEDKIFHAGPAASGFGVIFFGLYKDNKYEFCDGDFMDPGCYTGIYNLSGDTITLYELKKHNGIPTNKFLIRRYSEMDSSYWQWKYPNHKNDWESMRHHDLIIGSTGDVFPLDHNGKIINEQYNYFLIRLDSLKSKY